MKRQQLSNSFWLSLTAMVLVVQPAGADTVQVSTVQLKPTANGLEVALNTPKSTPPPVFTSSYGKTFVADIINTQLRLSKGNTFHATNPTNEITEVKVSSLDAKSIRVTVTGKGGLPQAKMVQSDKGLVLSLTTTSAQSLPRQSQVVVKNSASALSSPDPLQLSQSTSPSRIPDSNIRNTTTTPSYLNPSSNPLQFPTRAEEVRIQGTQPITLQQALELARRNNRPLQVAELTVERSRFVLREQQAALFPTLGIDAQVTNQASDVFSDAVEDQLNAAAALGGTTTTNTLGSTTDLRSTLSLNYTVFNSGGRRARIREAEEQVRFDQLDFERISEQLRLDVSNDYYDLQGADEQVRINQAAVVNARASLRDAEALEQAGVGTRFAVLQSQVQLANAIQELTNSLSQQQIERRQLAARLSLAQSINITAADPVEIAGLWNLALDESIVVAFQNRAELEQQLALRNQGEQRRRAALSTLGPQVSLSANYTYTEGFDDGEEFGDRYTVGPTVSLNLFDGGAARARANQEERNIAIAETTFADTRNQIRFEVEQAYANLGSNLENIQTASIGLEQAREALRLARLRFQAGVGTQTEVIDAEDDLTLAEGNRVTAILNYNRALASLQRAISSGRPR